MRPMPSMSQLLALLGPLVAMLITLTQSTANAFLLSHRKLLLQYARAQNPVIDEVVRTNLAGDLQNRRLVGILMTPNVARNLDKETSVNEGLAKMLDNKDFAKKNWDNDGDDELPKIIPTRRRHKRMHQLSRLRAIGAPRATLDLLRKIVERRRRVRQERRRRKT